MSEQIILHGAGSAGLETLKSMRDQGIYPVCFSDNDKRKQSHLIQGLQVLEPKNAQITYPKATWVVSIYKAEARDVREQLREMGVKVEPLGTHLPFCQPIPDSALEALDDIAHDHETAFELTQQVHFRGTMDYDRQSKPSPMSELYFPPFIKKIKNEVFVDCGAAGGDSIEAFTAWQPAYKAIIAFEPDHANYRKLYETVGSPEGKITHLGFGVSDHDGETSFVANGDYSSHVGAGSEKIRVVKLDVMCGKVEATFIKMDIEGSELRALWGARKLLKERMPVLAICAYHEPDHLWEIPLLIHAIQPDYELRLRRYAEGTRELVWYFVPRERIL